MNPADLSATTIAALAGAAVLIIGAFAGGIATVITAIKVAKIEAHVNSEKTAATEKIAALLNENELLRRFLNDQKQIAALLAQAASHQVAAVAAPTTAAVESLKHIEVNTADTVAALQTGDVKPGR